MIVWYVCFCLPQWCEQNEQCRRLHLPELLVAPLHRLTRYPLLLKNIWKRTTDSTEKIMIYSIKEKVEKSIRKSLRWVTQSSTVSLIKELGALRLLGTMQASILEGNSIDLRSWLSETRIWVWLHCKPNTHQTMGSSHILANPPWPSLRRTCSVSKAFRSEFRQEKFHFPDDWRHFVFNTRTELTHKANGSQHHGKSFWRINYHSSFY